MEEIVLKNSNFNKISNITSIFNLKNILKFQIANTSMQNIKNSRILWAIYSPTINISDLTLFNVILNQKSLFLIDSINFFWLLSSFLTSIKLNNETYCFEVTNSIFAFFDEPI